MTSQTTPQDGRWAFALSEARVSHAEILAITHQSTPQTQRLLHPLCGKVEVRSEDMPDAPTQIDGDPCSTLPITVETVPSRLRLMLPVSSD